MDTTRKRRRSTFCDYCGTQLTEHDEMRTAAGGRVCDECVDAMSEEEVELLLDDASKELL